MCEATLICVPSLVGVNTSLEKWRFYPQPQVCAKVDKMWAAGWREVKGGGWEMRRSKQFAQGSKVCPESSN